MQTRYKSMTTRKKRWIRFGIVAFVLAALMISAFYNGLVVRRYEVQTDKMDSGASVRIVVIADLHSHMYGEDQQPLIDKIAAQQPDVIALAGDIVDDDRQPWTQRRCSLRRLRASRRCIMCPATMNFGRGKAMNTSR